MNWVHRKRPLEAKMVTFLGFLRRRVSIIPSTGTPQDTRSNKPQDTDTITPGFFHLGT